MPGKLSRYGQRVHCRSFVRDVPFAIKWIKGMREPIVQRMPAWESPFAGNSLACISFSLWHRVPKIEDGVVIPQRRNKDAPDLRSAGCAQRGRMPQPCFATNPLRVPNHPLFGRIIRRFDKSEPVAVQDCSPPRRTARANRSESAQASCQTRKRGGGELQGHLPSQNMCSLIDLWRQTSLESRLTSMEQPRDPGLRLAARGAGGEAFQQGLRVGGEAGRDFRVCAVGVVRERGYFGEVRRQKKSAGAGSPMMESIQYWPAGRARKMGAPASIWEARKCSQN